ncbi:WYL domain-containing protein [Corynebacterium caspium]|uniref:WYL domain-containing protein n=1 Tax=Corynebacterium caspium TaxID=234828 RepID=UPI0003659E96|nr:WYL domain-containing protein [Corynebacterium caspium]WKD59304.1 hypothetical protein CCASP_04540 [Corynebacterium caspium DSM 44850]
MSSRSYNRLHDIVRSLNLLPYFERHPGRSVFEAAKDLSQDPSAIMDDLNRLFCCGLPGLMPDDLVDMNASYRSVEITNNQGLDRPLRLTSTEAAVLLMTLEYLEQLPGLIDSRAVESAAQKLRSLTHNGVPGIIDYTPALNSTDNTSQVVAQINAALQQQVKIEFIYFPTTQDVKQRRKISPIQILTIQGRHYLSAWDDTADNGLGGQRHFRIDRMHEVQLSTEQAALPDIGELAASNDPFGLATSPEVVILELQESATWMVDYFPLTITETEPQILATMPLGSVEWFIRFVLSNGDRIKVVAPKNLAIAVANAAARALKAYGED